MLCYIPTIVFHFSLIPLWNGNTAMVTKAASYSGARTMFFVPIYSLIINYILSEKFNTWQGNLEQVDDVLVIGIRV